jgi:hypothetical protein
MGQLVTSALEMWLGFILVFSLIEIIAGHGRLMEPPARNSMWRFGYGTPINYSDNEVFCGGVGIQFKKNDGKCGVCGDDWSLERPRENENGGKYGTGTISRTYVQGQVIEVEVELTTNHWGWFEMKLCPVNDKLGLEDDKCMDKHPLNLANEDSTKFFIPKDSKKKDTFKYKIKLPNNVVCSQCVLQWTYWTGNTWGICANGTGAMGCGDQEMFRNCADIKIISNVQHPPNIQLPRVPAPNAIFVSNDLEEEAAENRAQLVVRSQVCVPVAIHSNSTGMHEWCQENCLKYPPNCDPNYCQCLDECEAIGDLAGVEGTDVYCHRQCLV